MYSPVLYVYMYTSFYACAGHSLCVSVSLVLGLPVYVFFFFLMIRRPPRSTLDRSSAASDVYKRQALDQTERSLADHKTVAVSARVLVLQTSAIASHQRIAPGEDGIGAAR